jgi:carbohydrate kinase (thermoresistant glucokinase family)
MIMVLVLMGVSGCGKTTVGRMLAKRLGLAFYDGDDYHSPQNILKMKNGMPLDDRDRLPWLTDLAEHILKWNRGDGAVLACSALKEQYRRILSCDGQENVVFVHLEGDRHMIRSRMKKREDHYFPEELLESQFRDMEVPLNAIAVKTDKEPEAICSEIIDRLTCIKYIFQKNCGKNSE